MSAVFSAVSNYVQEQAWVFMALAVAVFWGMHYSTLDHVVQDRSPWTVLFWPAIFALVGQLGFGAKDITVIVCRSSSRGGIFWCCCSSASLHLGRTRSVCTPFRPRTRCWRGSLRSRTRCSRACSLGCSLATSSSPSTTSSAAYASLRE